MNQLDINEIATQSKQLDSLIARTIVACVQANDQLLLSELCKAVPPHHPFAGACYGILDCISLPESDSGKVAEKTGREKIDPAVRIQRLTYEFSHGYWYITPAITDRWGNPIDDNHDVLKCLEDLGEKRLKSLQQQMWGETTFVARKDGVYGVLFETEIRTKESEIDHPAGKPSDFDVLPLRADVETRLLRGMQSIKLRYPGVAFCVPHPSQIPMQRTGAWAFVRDGLLDDRQRDDLGQELERRR